jgi:hypothetical protein
MSLLLSSILRIPGVILRVSGGSNQHGYLAQRQGPPSSGESTQMDHFQLGLLNDKYQRWCQRPRDRFALESPPLEFWTSYAFKKTFPRLQKIALDVFTIPAMSDEPEKVFSSTGLMVRPHRSRLP